MSISSKPSNPSFKQPYQAPAFKIDTSKLIFAPKASPKLVSVNLKAVALPSVSFSPPINTFKPIPKLSVSKITKAPLPPTSLQTLDKLPANVPKLKELLTFDAMMHNADAYATKGMMLDISMQAAAARGVANAAAPYLKQACAIHPAVQKVCDGTVAVLTAGTEFISNSAVPPEKRTQQKKNIQLEAVRLNKKFGIPKTVTVQFYQDLEEVVTGKVFGVGLASGGMLLKNLSKLKPRIRPSLSPHIPETTDLAIRGNSLLSGSSKIRVEFVNGHDLASKLDYLEKYYKANNLPHPILVEVYHQGTHLWNIKRDFAVVTTNTATKAAQGAAKTQAAANKAVLLLPAPAQKLLPAPQATTATAKANLVVRIGPARLPNQEKIAQANRAALEKLRANNQKPNLTIVPKKLSRHKLYDVITGAPYNPSRKIRVLPTQPILKFKLPPAQVIARIGPPSLPGQAERTLANKVSISSNPLKKSSIAKKTIKLVVDAFMYATDLDFKALSTTSFTFIFPPFLKEKVSNRHLKTLEQIYQTAQKPKLNFSDAKALVDHIGGKYEERRGSRFSFEINRIKHIDHLPHSKELDPGAIKSLRKWLENIGISKDKTSLLKNAAISLMKEDSGCLHLDVLFRSKTKSEPNFVLVPEPINTKVSVVRQLSERKPRAERTLAEEQDALGLRKERRYYYDGSMHTSFISKNSNKTHTVFVQYIFNGVGIFKEVTEDSSKIIQPINILSLEKGASHAKKVLSSLINTAVTEGSNALILEFEAANKKILKLLHKKFEYQGRFSTSSFGFKVERGLHRFVIDLANK